MTDQKKIALVGNPNCGKTTLFNRITGAHQHVGNWGGVTVDITEGDCKVDGKPITFVDLPGTYSLSAFSLEEKVARDFIIIEKPDHVVNVIDGTNLERSLYLTVQLLELGVRPILAINMWDEVIDKGFKINLKRLGDLLGVEIVTTNGKSGKGIDEILSKVASEPRQELQPFTKHFTGELSTIIADITDSMKKSYTKAEYLPEWLAIKLLEGDSVITEMVAKLDEGNVLIQKSATDSRDLETTAGEDVESLISEARYGYATGIARETVVRDSIRARVNISDSIDKVLTHKFWAYPVFFFFLWLLFQVTFTVGAIPMGWIESLFGLLGDLATKVIPDGWVQDLIVDGIIAGVGGVAVFLPNILILFFGISIMEDTGYMARAAFIMDKFMHKLGLHGKSFIPMIMGLGCTVPAVMAARTLESPRDRIKTILLVPLISCSARMPVFVLFAGALFPEQAGNVVFLFNVVFGFSAFAVMSLVFRATLFKNVEDIPFVMELPPYRLPTMRSVMIHMWHKAEHYIVKMGTVVLFFSVLLWFAGEYPKDHSVVEKYETAIVTVQAESYPEQMIADSVFTLENAMNAELKERTALGRIGKVLEPATLTFGSDWRGAVSLLTGFVAKEVVVGSMGVLYSTGEIDDPEDSSLQNQLKKHFTPLSGIAFMLFVLLYTPCVVALATIIKELDNWKWSLFSIVYQPALAWIVATTVFQLGKLIGLG